MLDRTTDHACVCACGSCRRRPTKPVRAALKHFVSKKDSKPFFPTITGIITRQAQQQLQPSRPRVRLASSTRFRLGSSHQENPIPSESLSSNGRRRSVQRPKEAPQPPRLAVSTKLGVLASRKGAKAVSSPRIGPGSPPTRSRGGQARAGASPLTLSLQQIRMGTL